MVVVRLKLIGICPAESWSCNASSWSTEFCLKSSEQSATLSVITRHAVYKGSTTGRLFEQAGGVQSLPKAYKALASKGVIGLTNSEVRSCPLAIIFQWCREAGIVLSHTEEDVNNTRAKHAYAKKAGLPMVEQRTTDTHEACSSLVSNGVQEHPSLAIVQVTTATQHRCPETSNNIEPENFTMIGVCRGSVLTQCPSSLPCSFTE